MRSNGKSFLVIIVIALIMTLSLVGGYLVITGLSPEIKEKFDTYTDPLVERFRNNTQGGTEERVEQQEGRNENGDTAGDTAGDAEDADPEVKEFTYSGTARRDYTGPVIYEDLGYLFNSDGKVVSDFRGEDGSSLRITMNKDRSEAVFTYDHKGYYVDADLNITEFSDHVSLASMCFEGGYYFYVYDGDYNDELYLYDIRNKKETQIAQGDFRVVCISPDGRTLVYTQYPEREVIHVRGLDLEKEKTFDAGYVCTPVSVSDDGDTVFYYVYNSDTVYYCLDHGKNIKVDKKDYKDCYFDRECKQFLYSDNKHRIKYYKAGEKKPVTLTDKDDARILLNEGSAVRLDVYMDEHIINADTFSDAIMIKTDDRCYALFGYLPRLVDMAEGLDRVYFFDSFVNESGAQCVYSHKSTLYKAVYDGENVSRTVLYEGEHFGMDYVCNKDLTKVWVRDNGGIYFIEDGKEPRLLSETVEGESYTYYDVAYDPLEDICYYIVNEVLYCVDDTPESVERVADDCYTFSTSYNGIKPIIVRNANADYYLVIVKQKYLR